MLLVHAGRQTIPSIDHSVTEKELSNIQSGPHFNQLSIMASQ